MYRSNNNINHNDTDQAILTNFKSNLKILQLTNGTNKSMFICPT